jgi:hypothetical protein
MKKNSQCRKGTAILWAVLVMLMISLLTAGIIFISRVYYLREQNENYKYQARLYAESAIELISGEIETNGDTSNFVSSTNSTQTVTITFPDAPNWTCIVTVNHSVVNTTDPKNSGKIYLTAKVTRHVPEDKDGKEKTLELSEVCARMTYDKSHSKWIFDGYYNL